MAKGSKNNIANRGTGALVKKLNGKDVVPARVLRKGNNFIATQFKNGPLALDAQGNPIPYDKV